MKPNMKTNRDLNWSRVAFFIILPFLIAGAFIVIVTIQGQFRYDDQYFTPGYQETYNVPYLASHELETVLQLLEYLRRGYPDYQ